MPTTVTRTIKAAGGDYTSLAAWEAGENGDVVAADEIRVADCFDLGALDGAVVIAGGTVDATRYLQIQAHDAHGGAWNTSVYRIGLTGDGTVINNGQQRTRIIGIQIQTGVGSVNYGGDGVLHSFDSVTGTDVSTARVERCIIRGTGVSYVATGQLSYGIREPFGGNIAANNIIYGFLSTVNPSYGLWNAGYAKSVYYNNTVENCTKGISQGTIGATAYAKNNVVQLCGTCFEGSFDASSATNISDDGTHPAGKTATVAFVSTTLGSEDLHLAPGDTEAKGYGTDLSGDAVFPFSTDIDGETRTAPWDAGADQFTAASVPALRAIFEPTYDARGWFDHTATAPGWVDDDLIAAARGAALQTSLASAGTLTADLATGIPLSASVAAASSLTASLTTAIPLEASLAGGASGTAALTTEIRLTVALASVATLTGALTTAIVLEAALSGVSSVAADVVISKPLDATLAATATLVAAIESAIRLEAALGGSSAIAAELSTEILLTASLTGDATVIAVLTTAIPLATTLESAANLSAALGGGALLAASLAADSSASAELETAIALTASVSATSAATADLSTAISVTATLSAASAMDAALSVGAGLAAVLTAAAAILAVLADATPPIYRVIGPLHDLSRSVVLVDLSRSIMLTDRALAITMTDLSSSVTLTLEESSDG